MERVEEGVGEAETENRSTYLIDRIGVDLFSSEFTFVKVTSYPISLCFHFPILDKCRSKNCYSYNLTTYRNSP